MFHSRQASLLLALRRLRDTPRRTPGGKTRGASSSVSERFETSRLV
jgi:hypothetical protein